jgi:hypothetical protein
VRVDVEKAHTCALRNEVLDERSANATRAARNEHDPVY